MRVFLVTWFVLCCVVEAMRLEHNLIVMPNKRAYLEIKDDRPGVVPCDVTCNNGFSGQLSEKHVSHFDDLSVYRMAVGSTTGMAEELSCTIRNANASKEVESRSLLQYQKLRFIPPEEPFTVKAVRVPDHNFVGSFLSDDVVFTKLSTGEEKCERLQTNRAKSSFPIERLRAELGARKVFLSLTTTPDRLKYLHHVLDRIDTQLVDTIFISLPKYFHNDPDKGYTIPIELLQQFPNLKVIQSSFDIGPVLKLVGTCKFLRDQEPECNNLLVYLDDDNSYPKETINTLVHFALENPNAAIGGSNLDFGYSTFGFAPLSGIESEHLALAPILEGFASVIVPIGLVDYELLIEFCNWVTPSCTFSDDLIIGWTLNYSQVKMYGVRDDKVPEYFLSKSKVREFEWSKIGALHDLGHDDPEAAGFGGNFQRYNQATTILFEVTIDADKENLMFLPRDEIIKQLRAKKRAQIQAMSTK